jgi:hypothetical protein
VKLVARGIEAFAAPRPATESNFPRVPICIKSLPSGAYFWIAPSPLPATHTLFSWSTKQPWIEPGTVV